MHREYERAINGTERRSRSHLTWLFAAIGIFLVVGVGGAMIATAGARRAVVRLEQRIRHASRHAPEAESEVAAARLVKQLQAHEALLSVRPEEGLRFLRSLRSADPSEDFMKAFVGVRDRARAEAAGGQDAHADASSSSDGASLTFGTDEGQVSLHLRRTDSGGTLSIQGPDGNARIDLVRTDDGGYLTIDSDDGGVRFDLTRGENGGRLEVSTDDGETLHLGFGESARSIPSWVPLMDGFPEPPRPVYSLDGTEGELGAVALEGDASVEEVLSFYKDRLEAAGYRMDAEHRRSDADLDEGSLWARDDDSGRMVFVAAHRHDGTTKLLLGYGERTP